MIIVGSRVGVPRGAHPVQGYPQGFIKHKVSPAIFSKITINLLRSFHIQNDVSRTTRSPQSANVTSPSPKPGSKSGSSKGNCNIQPVTKERQSLPGPDSRPGWCPSTQQGSDTLFPHDPLLTGKWHCSSMWQERKDDCPRLRAQLVQGLHRFVRVGGAPGAFSSQHMHTCRKLVS